MLMVSVVDGRAELLMKFSSGRSGVKVWCAATAAVLTHANARIRVSQDRIRETPQRSRDGETPEGDGPRVPDSQSANPRLLRLN